MLRVIHLTLIVLAAAASVHAQTSATIEGVVRDSTGAIVAGVALEAAAAQTATVRTTTTASDGTYRLLGLATGVRWEVRATSGGFGEQRRVVEALAAGEHRVLDFELRPASVNAQVTVTRELPIGRTTTPELGGTVRRQQIEQLPVNGRDLISLAYLVPGAAPARGFYNLAPRLTINGSSSLVTNYSIDGFDNTDLFLGGPKIAATLESTDTLRVLVNSYSSEYGRTGNGVFSVTTRSGSSTAHGDAFYVVRPGSLIDTANFFAPRDANGRIIPDDFRRHQFGGSLGGPLGSNRTLYFGNAEITRERQDAILTSPLAAGLAPTTFHNHEALGKIDRHWNVDQATALRYAFSDYTHDKDAQFIGGLTLPSAGLQVNYRNQFVALSHRSVIASRAFNELGLQVGQLRADWRPLDSGPRIIVTDRGATLAVIGAVSDNFFWTENDLQIRDVYSRMAGRHTLRVGGDLLRADFDIRSGPGARGAYTIDLQGQRVTPSGPFLTAADLPRSAAVLSYSQTFLNPEVRHPQTLLAAFAEDSIHATPDLTLSVGCRWDYDSVTNTPVGHPDVNNVAPRLGFSWTPAGTVRHQVRGGYGVFYERIPFAVYSDTIFNSPNGGAIGVTFAPGTPFAPPLFPSQLPRDAFSGAPISQLPPRDVQVFDPNVKSPWNQQISIGYVFAVSNDFAVAADYVHNRGYNLVRRIDANAAASVPPGVERSVAAADLTRPSVPVAGGFRLIEEDQFSGHSRFNGLYLSARKRFSYGFAFDLAYTASKVENDTDDINFRPVDSRNPDAEWGPSLNARRHVLAASGQVRLPYEIDLLPALFLSSGQPLNVVTGADENGDTIVNDRPAGFGRNSDRTSGFTQLDLAVIRSFRLRRQRLEVRAEVFNVFNATNFSGFFNFGASGVRPDEKGTLAFQPTVAGPARQFQFDVFVRF
jgi:carboxypeptidase family protein/TonB-dependent receptor-like protein